jgi:hypothetical protein
MDYTAAVQEACELTAQKGYDLQTWMIVLNRETGTDPDRLRRASAILSGVTDLLRKNAVSSNG